MILAAGAITRVVMVMVFAAEAVVFAAVLLRGNFSVGTSTMGTLHEKLLRGPPYRKLLLGLLLVTFCELLAGILLKE